MAAKSPAFTIVAAVTLALGIGATTAIFSLVNAVLLRPLPVADRSQLTALYTDYRGADGVGDWSYPHYRELRDRSGIFTGVAAQSGLDLSVTIGDHAELVWANIVSENYFTVLGMTPALGRLFVPDDDRGPGSDPIAVLSDDAWQRRFAGDPTVVGRHIRVNGHPFTIVGVAPRGFHGTRLLGYWAEMWVPLMAHADVLPGSGDVLQQRNNLWLLLMGRMPAGMTITEAQARTTAFARRLGEQDTGPRRLQGAVLIPAGTLFDNPSWVSRGVLTFASSLGLGAALMVLMVACSNVATSSSRARRRAARRSRRVWRATRVDPLVALRS
jgi:hypothetical protein